MARFEIEITTVIKIDISDEILALHKDKEWAAHSYDLDTQEKIAEHLAWNCGLRRAEVYELDGFADRSGHEVNAVITDTYFDTFHMETK